MAQYPQLVQDGVAHDVLIDFCQGNMGSDHTDAQKLIDHQHEHTTGFEAGFKKLGVTVEIEFFRFYIRFVDRSGYDGIQLTLGKVFHSSFQRLQGSFTCIGVDLPSSTLAESSMQLMIFAAANNGFVDGADRIEAEIFEVKRFAMVGSHFGGAVYHGSAQLQMRLSARDFMMTS